MIFRYIAACLVWCLLIAAPLAVGAQEINPAAAPVTDYENFASVAERAEALAASDNTSAFSISRLRSELVMWRDVFLQKTDMNAGRIATVDAQLAALGPVPEDGEEAAAVAERRAQLVSQRQDLFAPRLLAQEAFARANGIIGELDALILRQETAALTQRGPSPFNPVHLLAGAAATFQLLQLVGIEAVAGVRMAISSGRLWQILPNALAFFAFGVGLLWAGRQAISRWRDRMLEREGGVVPLSAFFISLGQMIVSLIGVLAITEGLQVLDVFGLRGENMIGALSLSGFIVVFGVWLAQQVFPTGPGTGYLGYDAQTRAAGRRYSYAMVWILGLAGLLQAGFATIEMTDGGRAALHFVVLGLLGVVFWRLGQVIRTPPQAEVEPAVSSGRMRSLIGRLCTITAIVGPVLVAIGFTAAGRALMIPAIFSLGLLGTVFLFQRIVHDVSPAHSPEETGNGAYALLPVMISFMLYLLSLPVFALIWGASGADLLEVWSRFRTGFTIGETQISPADFIAFAAVFALGYLLTRFIQGTLRKTVMPRTRLDLGGQNAVVAGFGYVGIFLAAIIAITSAGIDLSNLAIVAGALSVGIGFGLQNVVSNFVSGIILLIERPVSEGDWIEVGGQMGYVRAISVRSTRIETFDRTDVIIPNADLVSGQVTNWTRGNLVGRAIVPVGVAYGSDAEKVSGILQEIAEAHPMVVLTPPPAVLFVGFGESSLDFEIRAILRDVNYVLVTKSELNHEIARKFAEQGIEIPFAQRDLWLRNPEVLKGDA